MSVVESNPNRTRVIWLSAALSFVVVLLSFPEQCQWFITRRLVNSELGYERYIRNHPKSAYLAEASWLRANLSDEAEFYLNFARDFPQHPERELALWRAAKTMRDPAVFAKYLRAFPEGKLAAEDGANVNSMRISVKVYEAELKRQSSLFYGKVLDFSGHSYRSIQLGGLTWLADNLKVSVPIESFCYLNLESLCQKYGALYSWKGAQKACAELGTGWRLPTLAEWEQLCKRYDPEMDFNVGSSKVYRAMIRGGNSGFEVRGSGYFTPQNNFLRLYYDAAFWTATGNPDAEFEAYEVAFISTGKRAFRASVDQDYGLSCRCVRDSL